MNVNKMPIVVVPKRPAQYKIQQIQQQQPIQSLQQQNDQAYRNVQVIKKIDLDGGFMKKEKIEESIPSQKLEEEYKQQNFIEKDQNMDIEECSQKSEKIQEPQDPFINFVNSYSLFINDAQAANLDLDLVLNNLNNAINLCKPPVNDATLNQFHEQLIIQPDSINQLAYQLKNLPDQKLYQCIQYVEKLNVKLFLDYNIEVKKGNETGIIKEEDK